MEAPALEDRLPWYRGVTPYQWLVLALASAGWIFDVYEGQIFNLTRNRLLEEVLRENSESSVKFAGDLALAFFLVGGTLGGIAFGSLADRWGRRPTMVVTILAYSIFSGLTYFAHSLWQVVGLRFLVALGVGGEWAVAAALVAEVFPQRARAYASGIFHASSVLGTWLAALAGIAAGANWRLAYLLGLLPALLVLWIRSGMKEPEVWVQSSRQGASIAAGSLRELLFDRRWRLRAILGMLLAAVGLGSFWGVTIAGQDLAREMLLREGKTKSVAESRSQFAYGIVETIGGGMGLLAFGPLCVRLGRRRAFLLMQLAAAAFVPVTCVAPASYEELLRFLPVFGFLTLGMHAGFAIYFPELFPTHLRATGAAFCFNGGRLVAAPMLVFSGWLKSLLAPGDVRAAVSWLGLIYLAGAVVVLFLPETKDQPLPE